MGDRLAAPLPAHDGLALAVRAVAADGRIHRAAHARGHAPHQRAILADQRQGAPMVGEQRRQSLMRRVGLGDDEQP